MKRTVKILIAVYLAVFMCVFGGINAFAWDVDTRRQNITLKNAPEGTAFADILVKDKKNDKYAVDFNEENGDLLGVGKDCGLAKYSKDGYTSMLLRHNCAVFEKADNSDSMNVVFGLTKENNELFNHFSQIKVVCCGKDGNILGITNEVKVKYVFWGMPDYRIEANGSSLICEVNTGPPYFMIVLVPLTAAVLLFIITAAIIIVKVRKRRRQRK